MWPAGLEAIVRHHLLVRLSHHHLLLGEVTVLWAHLLTGLAHDVAHGTGIHAGIDHAYNYVSRLDGTMNIVNETYQHCPVQRWGDLRRPCYLALDEP